MPFRPQPREIVLGILLAVSLLGLAAGSRADGLLRHDYRDSAGAPLLAGGMERTVLRAQNTDHVRAQIERMEARARADERLSGRRGAQPAPAPQPTESVRSTQADNSASADSRPATAGPGWQSPGRDSSR
ncbi:hypothetical protein L602_000700001210 [Cupriavidus gilardii J11]|uniref:Uncharacterized protein n=1 Tax=Cupriavidus gilardii J11 TaxID=936133 RepID=A0A562B2A3_9BURK|nr:hypothetical protein [Cupriavidus gilardii]TWG79305.1 hypothetical protein L602_000700001210 [Cupriavidus gilardii J11]